MNLTYIEYQKRRKYLLKSADKTHIYQRKSRDVKTIHLCALCGRPLTTYLPLSATYMTTIKHYYFKHDFITIALCFNPKQCFNSIQGQV